MRFLAGEELKIKNFAAAASYYLKGESICGGYDKANYARMLGTFRNAMNSVKDKAVKKAYADTIEGAFQRAEAANAYDLKDDLFRAGNILQSSKPNRKKADELFRRGINASGTGTNQAYVSYFYYNTYAMFSEASAEAQPDLKRRLIAEYFELSSLISEANMSVKTQETITTYFNYVVKSCDDILPDLKGYLKNLPSDPKVKKSAVMNFIALLEKKECESAPEYLQLIDTLVAIDPNSFDAVLMKAKAEVAEKKYSAGIATYRKAKGLTNDAAVKQEIQYEIARAQFKQGSYSAAYKTAMTVSGKHKGKALTIAGQCVGKTANNCGKSSFDRKCNYIYAVQLLEQAKANGEGVGGMISKYRNNFPTEAECFDNGSPASVTLTCYGISVSPCK